MSSTNKTTYYELSQYVGSDKPTYLGDYNSDMLKIDTAIHTASDNANTALTTANAANSAATSASTTASTALSTAQTASTTATQAQTTAETALTNAGAAQSAAEVAETAARANVITNLAPAYDSSLTYNVGDLVTYIDVQGSGKMYKCIIAVTTPEAFNINKWDDVTTSEAYGKKLIATTTATGSTTTWGDICQFIALNTFDKNKMYWLQEEYSDGTLRTFIMQEITANDKPVFTRIDFAAAYVALWNIDSTTARNCKLETTGTTILDRTNDTISSLDTTWYIVEQ